MSLFETKINPLFELGYTMCLYPLVSNTEGSFPPQNLFSINPSTGAISVSGTLDRETVQTAVLVVTVKDTKADTEGQTATGWPFTSSYPRRRLGMEMRL